MASLVSQPVAWLIVVALLAACWPLAQAMRHEKLRPLAAYLLFTSVLALVSGGIFVGLMQVLIVTGAAPAVNNLMVAGIAVLALAAGVLAGRWILRYPQWRKMPR